MSKGTLNKAIVIGRLGKDPELKYTNNGTPVATFSVATDSSYKAKDSEETVQQTDWHRIVAWRKLAEICGQYLKKGSLVYIEGQIKTRQYDDNDGVKRYVTEIVADKMEMLGGKPATDSSDAPAPSEEHREHVVDNATNDELLF